MVAIGSDNPPESVEKNMSFYLIFKTAGKKKRISEKTNYLNTYTRNWNEKWGMDYYHLGSFLLPSILVDAINDIHCYIFTE